MIELDVICFRFLNVKIQEGEAHNIFCPACDCYQLVPVQVIESVVSREMDKRYLQFDIKARTHTYTYTHARFAKPPPCGLGSKVKQS